MSENADAPAPASKQIQGGLVNSGYEIYSDTQIREENGKPYETSFGAYSERLAIRQVMDPSPPATVPPEESVAAGSMSICFPNCGQQKLTGGESAGTDTSVHYSDQTGVSSDAAEPERCTSAVTGSAQVNGPLLPDQSQSAGKMSKETRGRRQAGKPRAGSITPPDSFFARVREQQSMGPGQFLHPGRVRQAAHAGVEPTAPSAGDQDVQHDVSRHGPADSHPATEPDHAPGNLKSGTDAATVRAVNSDGQHDVQQGNGQDRAGVPFHVDDPVATSSASLRKKNRKTAGAPALPSGEPREPRVMINLLEVRVSSSEQGPVQAQGRGADSSDFISRLYLRDI